MHPVFTYRKPRYSNTFPRWFPRMFPHKWERVLYRISSALMMGMMPILVISGLFSGTTAQNAAGEVVFRMAWVFHTSFGVMLAGLALFCWLMVRVVQRRKNDPKYT